MSNKDPRKGKEATPMICRVQGMQFFQDADQKAQAERLTRMLGEMPNNGYPKLVSENVWVLDKAEEWTMEIDMEHLDQFKLYCRLSSEHDRSLEVFVAWLITRTRGLQLVVND